MSPASGSVYELFHSALFCLAFVWWHRRVELDLSTLFFVWGPQLMQGPRTGIHSKVGEFGPTPPWCAYGQTFLNASKWGETALCKQLRGAWPPQTLSCQCVHPCGTQLIINAQWLLINHGAFLSIQGPWSHYQSQRSHKLKQQHMTVQVKTKRKASVTLLCKLTTQFQEWL